jgi:hypothetical protein
MARLTDPWFDAKFIGDYALDKGITQMRRIDPQANYRTSRGLGPRAWPMICGGAMQRMSITWWCDTMTELENFTWAVMVFGDMGREQVRALANPIIERLRANHHPQAMVRLSSSLRRGEALHTLLGKAVAPDQGTEVLAPDETEKIAGALAAYKQALGDELAALDAFYVVPQGAFSMPVLIDAADRAAGPMHEQLPTQVREDLKAAGRCLAFDLPTAAGFHTARALEAHMLALRLAAGCAALTANNRNWGQYINDIEQKSNVSASVITTLRGVKDNYRNPLVHPEFTMDAQDALLFWTTCIGLIGSMSKEIGRLVPAAKPESATPPPEGAAVPEAEAA